MSDKDIAIGTVGLPVGSQINKKPSYLILLEGAGKTSKVKFITLDKPELLNNFVQVKGFYSDLSEEVIYKDYQNLILSVDRDSIMEILFPVHKILSMRSLVFKAK
jgi:hypothetical protein